MVDLIGGNVQVMFENVASGTPHVRSGKVRALGVTGRTRAPDAAVRRNQVETAKRSAVIKATNIRVD
jgi:tripartite-type tricarboxylate transporter receptor subunit TctC